MPDRLLDGVAREENTDVEGVQADETDEVLAVLRALSKRTTNPVVRACLAEAAADIADRTSCGGPSPMEKRLGE
jgi:hypothetical protein